MKINQITENTTSGSIATVDTALGATQSRGNPSIYGGKKVGSLFKGKKTKAPYANSVNESADLSEAHLEEDDIIVVPGQGRNRKNGLVPHGQSRLDHEVEMARSDLFQAAKNAKQVYSMIKDVGEDEGLEGWVQEKIIKANDYLNTVREYLEGKQTQGVSEGSQRGDTLVTDALKIMRGPEVNDAVLALKTVLGDREYNSRRGFYNFYVRQILDTYGQQGVTEGSLNELSPGLLQRAAQVAKNKSNKAMDPEIHNALGGGYTNPLAKHYDAVSQKLGDKAVKAGQRDAIKKVASPAVMRKTGMSGVAEGKRNLKCVCKTHGTMQCPVHTPKDIEVIEGAKVDRMVKHVAQSEKKLGHSKKEAENIAWATANKRGMLDNKNKKA